MFKKISEDNWQRVRKIFEDALSIKTEDRARFVKSACGDDELLLFEVESLLSSFDSADGFLETPAIAKVAHLIETETKNLERGKCFGHYEIVRQIGRGGMGEVYLARDRKLDRQVAIKILNEKFSRHESNLNRFISEAKSASALNHPNILVIHEIGESGKTHYIVSEFINGRTLHEICKEKRLKIAEVLDIAIQTAAALVAAHEAHLVHRDIKPENIMIRPDGFVKILDFGLAKLIERKNKSVLGLDKSNFRQNQTAKGVILGTVQYMSPEQAKGEPVDERTDIFSLGAVIYEMLAGRTPFSGDSVSETFVNVINAEPPPLSRFVANIPEQLQLIVSKMLCKNRENRYQTMENLLAELKSLEKRWVTEPEIETKADSDQSADDETQVLGIFTGSEANATKNRKTAWLSFAPTGAQSGKIRKITAQLAARATAVSVKIKERKIMAAAFLLIFSFAAVAGITLIFNGRAGKYEVSSNVKADPAIKTYWQMNEAEQLTFIQQRASHVQTLIGDQPTNLDKEALQAIKARIDYYVEKKDSLSQKPFEEGLRVIYGRASQYAPLIIRAYEKQKVPPALGLYQAMTESEYHDCITNSNGPIGLFQFLPKTAAKYGLEPKDYCNVEKQSEAAARFMSDLISDFGEGKSSWTLALLSYNQGEGDTREQLRQLRRRGITERSFWAVFRYQNNLQPPLPDDGKQYVPSFFAAAIIGETPEVFGLLIPPLTNLGEQDK